MKVYVVVDDNGGMMFNYRRQSQDCLLREDIINDCAGTVLWLSKYSAEQFADDFPTGFPDSVKIDDEFFRKMSPSDTCFVEEYALSFHLHQIDELVIYRWNKVYPADFYFDLDLKDGTWSKVSVLEMKGNSHEIITKEVWKRENY